MIGAILLGLGIALLATLVVVLAKITVKAIVERVKKKNRDRVRLSEAKRLLGEILKEKENMKNKADAISIDELAALCGQQGVIEYCVDSEGKVNPDDIAILQSDEMEAGLKNLFDQNDGELILTA